ncbi:hypothetical protein FXO37_34552 [Capsicum annuum]|nr:hypothetical protein FXO37_34552 [Capsicum annuum]
MPGLMNQALIIVGALVFAVAWPKLGQGTKPPIPRVTHSLSTKMRAQEAMKAEIIHIDPLKITTKQGLLTVVFKSEDYAVKLAQRYRFTLIGKFENSMPNMGVIRQ